MRSLVDLFVDPGLDRDRQIAASAIGALLGIAMSLGILIGSPILIGALLG